MTHDELWLRKYGEVKAWMEVHHHYPPEHTLLHNWVRRNKGEDCYRFTKVEHERLLGNG